MLLKRMIGCALGLSLGFAAASANAGEPGWYMGISGGSATADLDQDLYDDIVLSAFESVGDVLSGESSLDDNDMTWSIFGGYRLNSYIAIEAAYLDLGEPGYHAEGVLDPFGAVPPPCQVDTDPNVAIDFSDEVLPTLFENNLNEAAGICGNVAIDWDQDGMMEPAVSRDFDRDGQFNLVCVGSDDWSAIQLIKNRPDDPVDCAGGGGGGGGATPETIDCIVE